MYLSISDTEVMCMEEVKTEEKPERRPKRTNAQLRDQICEFLKSRPMSAYELSQYLGCNAVTVMRHILYLEGIHVIAPINYKVKKMIGKEIFDTTVEKFTLIRGG